MAQFSNGRDRVYTRDAPHVDILMLSFGVKSTPIGEADLVLDMLEPERSCRHAAVFRTTLFLGRTLVTHIHFRLA